MSSPRPGVPFERGDPVPDPVWQPYAERLAERLVRAGLLTDGRWRDALLDTPRHHFAPSHYRAPTHTRWRRTVRVETEHGTREWLGATYDRTRLIVALSEIDPLGRQYPVAVCPDPGLVMRMLHSLDVRATDHVLEIGTGSGYTAALLSHRVSAPQVTTVEIDPELHHLAAGRLAQLNLRPHQVLADSTALDAPCLGLAPRHAEPDGHPAPDRYDRVAVGHTIDHVPPGWLDLLAPEARMLVVLTGGLAAGHPALLRPTPADPAPPGRRGAAATIATISGSFLSWPAHDLPARRHTHLAATRRPATAVEDRPRHGTTPVDPTVLHRNTPLTLLIQQQLPAGTTSAVRADADATTATYLHAPDGSWAEINHHRTRHGLHDTRAAGPADLIAALHTARETYLDLHRPDWTDLGITVTAPEHHSSDGGASAETADGACGRSTVIWHGHPDSGTRWPVHPAPAPTWPREEP